MDILFNGWKAIGGTLLIGVIAYAALVMLLRASGKRTLSKWNAFDLIVTVALGSSLATSILSNQVALLQGILAFAVLIGLQFLVTWLSVRSDIFQHIIKSAPTLLLYQGEFLREAMVRQRVTEAEILAALREKGYAEAERVAAVVLETDGSFSVIREMRGRGSSAMADVAGFEGLKE